MEKIDAQLDRRLEQLRESIRNKRANIADLEEILHQDVAKMKVLPWYFWVFLALHFYFMLQGWCTGQTIEFLSNCAMVVWLQRKLYREIYLRAAIFTGLGVLLLNYIRL